MAEKLNPTLENDGVRNWVVVRIDNVGEESEEYFEADLTIVASCDTEFEAEHKKRTLHTPDGFRYIVMSIREFREAGYEIN